MQIKGVTDQKGMRSAERTLSELRGLEEEITTSKKWIKSPIQQILNAIEGYAKELSAPVTFQKERIAKLASGYIKDLEAARAAEEHKREEEVKRQMEALEAQKNEALRLAQQAKDEAERARQAQAAAEAQLAAEMAQEIANIRKPPLAPIKVTGGRVNHDHEFKLINVRELVATEGGWELLRYELDLLSCKDRVKSQIDRGLKPEIPGVQITPTTKLHMRPGARIR